MKWPGILIFICTLSAISYNSIGQLSAVTLTGICIKKYDSFILKNGSTFLKNENAKGNIEYVIDEPFKNSFTNSSVYLCYAKPIDQRCVPDGEPTDFAHRFYVIDKNSWISVDLKNIDTFNKRFNSEVVHFSALDKCYLYLFLNNIELHGVNTPDLYRNSIKKNSLFLSFKYYVLFSTHVGELIPSLHSNVSKYKMGTDFYDSNHKRIFIYALKRKNNEDITLRYNFTFDKNENLENVVVDNFKIE